MERLRRVLCVVAALVLPGCGSSDIAGSELCIPAAPQIEARQTTDRIHIEYEVPESDCRPAAIQVTAHSVDKLDNIAPRPGSGGPVELSGKTGVVELKLPPLDLPPYEALASTMTTRGRRSATTKVPVPLSTDYCRRTRSAATCIARAQAKFMRCLRGTAPRDECPDYVWNARPLIPYEPLRGVTRVGLERSFEFMARRGGAEFVSVECPSLRQCVATWRAYWGILRSRYAVSGYGSRAGCWIGERRAILKEDPPPEHVSPLRHVVGDRLSACVDWVR